MSPQDARRLVGQPDIVEDIRTVQEWCFTQSTGAAADRVVAEIDRLRAMVATINHDFSMARVQIEDLRAALRAVRGSTDPEFSAWLISHALRETKP